MRRFISTLLAMVMCVSFSSMAFAAEATEADEPMMIGETLTVTSDNNGEAVIEVPATAVENEILPMSGAETWSKVGGKVKVGSFTMEGNNRTPVKTIGVNGYDLAIYAEYSCSKSVVLTAQIVKAYESTTLGGGDGDSVLGKTGKVSTGLAYVNKGDKVQIRFRIFDANGNYLPNQTCTITYWYQFVKRF